MPDLRQAVTLTRRYQRQLATISARSESAASRLWDDLGSWDEGDVERFGELLTPVAEGAQRAAIATTAGFLSLMVGRPESVDPASILAAVDPRSPFLAYWAALNRGEQWVEAITTGRTRAGTVVLDSITTSARDAAVEVDATEERVTRWERIPGGTACEFCATVAHDRYRTAESASFGHERCNCAVVPVVDGVAPGKVLNRSIDAVERFDDAPVAAP